MKKIDLVLPYLDHLFPEPEPELNFSNNFELMVAVILSAQCTDKRVNIVTKDLFKIANTPEKMLELGIDKLKIIIHPCGFYNTKAKAIIESSNDLIKKFKSQVPSTMEELITLKGVGRKTANVVLANAFGDQTIAVDTHVIRVSKRLELTSENSNPTKCELDLLKIVPENKRSRFHHQMVLFGRYKCKAIKPECSECRLQSICKYYKKAKNKDNTNKKVSKLNNNKQTIK